MATDFRLLAPYGSPELLDAIADQLDWQDTDDATGEAVDRLLVMRGDPEAAMRREAVAETHAKSTKMNKKTWWRIRSRMARACATAYKGWHREPLLVEDKDSAMNL